MTHVHSCDSALTTRRYLLLIAMSLTEMIWGTSLTAVAMYVNIAPGLFPYVSWAYVHADFSRIGQYATVEFTDRALQQLYLFFWAIPASSFIFFVFFGFGEEAVRDYRRVGSWVAHKGLGIPVKHDKSAMSFLPVRYADHPFLPPLVADACFSPCSRPSMSTTKFSSFSPSSTSFGDDKAIALPAYLPRSHVPAPEPDKYTHLYVSPSPVSPARSEAWTHRTSGLSDAELDVLLARCPSISTCAASPRSPLEFDSCVEHPALASVRASIRAPSPAYSSVGVSERSRYSTRSSVAATCAGSPAPARLSCGYEHYAV